MKTAEMIYKLHQYCLDNNLSVVYYHSSGSTRDPERYINTMVNFAGEKTRPGIVIEELNTVFSPAQIVTMGWKEIQERLDYEILTRTFS